MVTRITRKRKKDFIGNDFKMNAFSVKHKGRKNVNDIQVVFYLDELSSTARGTFSRGIVPPCVLEHVGGNKNGLK